MQKVFWLLITIGMMGEELTLETPFMMEGIKQPLLQHIIARQEKKYSHKVFHKYIRLYTFQTYDSNATNKKLYAFTKLVRGLLDDAAQQHLKNQNYYIFKTAPITTIRSITCVIFGLRKDSLSSDLLNTLMKRINKKILGKEIKLYINNKEKFDRKHYLEDFNSFTEAERELHWRTTKKCRQDIKFMFENRYKM